ncbi:MAG: flagellar biosynthesis protein FlhB [Pseudoxanthomonas sp.]
MSEDDQERTEQPSEKRLRDARDQGNIPRSRELATAAVFTSGVIAVMAAGGGIGRSTRDWLKQALTPPRTLLETPHELLPYFGHQILKLMLVMWPLMLVALLTALISPIAMGGFQFNTKSLAPNLGRMNPMAGIKRMWGGESVAELIKSILRVLLVGGAAGLTLWSGMKLLRSLLNMPLELAMSQGVGFALKMLFATAGALALLAAIDAPYQKWNWKRKLMMSREELKREMKESEGSPEVKGKIRQMQHQMSQRRMMEAVPTADVVVVNPTHYAVALKYENGKARAPIVVAKGVDETAFRIREMAEQHKVAILSAPPLARALYREGDLGKEIPVRLYAAVAQVLSYVYQLRNWRAAGGQYPSQPAVDVQEFTDGRANGAPDGADL